jgi:hypothetical protein
MGILDKLLRRKPDHDQWLADHAGKGKVTMDAPAISEADEAATRSRMEAELVEQRTRRENG